MGDFINEVNKKNAKEEKKQIVLEERRRKENNEFDLNRAKFHLSAMFDAIVDAYANMGVGEGCVETDNLILFKNDDGEIYGKIDDKYFSSVQNYECVNALGLSVPRHVLIFSSPLQLEVVKEKSDDGNFDKSIKLYEIRSVVVLKNKNKKHIYKVDGEHTHMLIRTPRFDAKSDEEIVRMVKEEIDSVYKMAIPYKVEEHIKARKALKDFKKIGGN